MSKLSSLSKQHLFNSKTNTYESGFEEGFKQAFSHIKEQLVSELNILDQYPMMTERRMAILAYMKKMDSFLEEVQQNEY